MAEGSETQFASLDQKNVARTALNSAGIEPARFKQLLTLIQGPEALEGLIELLSSLILVVPLTHEIAQLENNSTTINKILTSFTETTTGLLAISDVLRREGHVQLFENRLKSRHEIFKRLLKRHPLYACLGLLPLIDDENKGYQQLQAQLLLFSARSPGEDLSSHINMFRAIADLCEPKRKVDLLSLPEQTLTAIEYYEQLSQSSSERVRVIGQLFTELPQPLQQPTSVKKPASPIRRKRHTVPKTTGQLSDSKALPPSRKSILTDTEAKDYESQGGHREEFQPADEEIPSEIPDKILSGETFRNLCFMAKQESNRRAINNQLFHFAWQEASLFDLSVLLDYIRGGLNLPNDTPATIEVKSALFLSLFLGRSLDELASLMSMPQDRPLPDTDEGIFLSPQGELYARIYSPGPELSEENKNRDWPDAYPVITFSHIPLPVLCPEVFEYLKPTPNTFARRLFPGNALDWQKNADLAIRSMRKARGCRLSPARISQYMVNELSRQESEDLPKAALYFGLDIDLAETRVHYSIAHLPAMEKSYRSLCNGIFDKLELEPAFVTTTSSVNPDAYVGSPFCPRLDAVQNLIKSIQVRLRKLEKTLTDKTGLLQYHNHYTLYSALQTAYASGYRAIIDSFLKPKELDLETGMAVISDKDTPDKYNTRQVWIHPMCRKQIHYYQQHLLALFDQIGLNSHTVFSKFQNQVWPEVLSDFFLFKDASLDHFEQLTPTVLRTSLAAEYDYDMPPNSNRHFLKNQLIENLCPQEIVESFLGHWHNGQEPWNSLSALHPADYRNYLETHLTKVLSTCGWRSIPGRFP